MCAFILRLGLLVFAIFEPIARYLAYLVITIVWVLDYETDKIAGLLLCGTVSETDLSINTISWRNFLQSQSYV